MSPRTIALIGDDHTHHADLHMALDQAGYDVTTAPYAAAMQRVPQLHPQLVVLAMDAQPDHPGRAVLAHLAAQPLPHPPVMVVCPPGPRGQPPLNPASLPQDTILVPTPCSPGQVLTLLARLLPGSSGGPMVLAEQTGAAPDSTPTAAGGAAAAESLTRLREQIQTTLRLVHTTQTILADLRMELARMRGTTAALRRESADLLAHTRASRQGWTASQTRIGSAPAPEQTLEHGAG